MDERAAEEAALLARLTEIDEVVTPAHVAARFAELAAAVPLYAASGSPRIHYLCRPCWGILEPGREPHVAIIDDPEFKPHAACCRCGQAHSSGIWQSGLRHEFPCGGEHPDG